MLTLIGVVVFAIIGSRAVRLSRKHAIWIFIIAIIDVFFRTEMASKKAAAAGYLFQWSPLAFVNATAFSVGIMGLFLLSGAWWGSRRRIKRAMKSTSADLAE